MLQALAIRHHGAVDGVTGSCHQLCLPGGDSVLIDCGLFQGAETSSDGAAAERLQIGFALQDVRALVVTHVHIDHVGRIPYLLAAGFQGPIFCTEASAHLLPMVLEDAIRIGFTRDASLVQRFMGQLRKQIVPIPYKLWRPVVEQGSTRLRMRFQPAGHILGSAYVEFQIDAGAESCTVVFSGDLGAPHTPLLAAPISPEKADLLVLESTYGDRLHDSRHDRRLRLKAICERAMNNGGTVLIPAFSIGRTQELLCEMEDVMHRFGTDRAASGTPWNDVPIIVDSPLAADFTNGYTTLRQHWDSEAQEQWKQGRHPLAFDQLHTIKDHDTHMRAVDALARSHKPAMVIAASGMCTGGRIVNYLKRMLGDARHDVLFCGYQAAGTPGRVIQRDGPAGGTVELDGERVRIRAGVHTLSGYSAHADQRNLIDFVKGIERPPKEIRLVHGEQVAKEALRRALLQQLPGLQVSIP